MTTYARYDIDNSSLEISEKIDHTSNEYSYYEKYTGKDGIVILGTSTQLKDDGHGNIVPGNSLMGIWFYDKKYLENINGIQELLDSFSNTEQPIKKLQEFNNNIYFKKHILPDLHTAALVCTRRQYNSNGQDTRYSVEKEKADGSKVNLSFAYATSQDFREQLRNLYCSIIGFEGLEKTMFDLCEVSDTIRPSTDEGVKFNAKEVINTVRIKVAANLENKQLVK